MPGKCAERLNEPVTTRPAQPHHHELASRTSFGACYGWQQHYIRSTGSWYQATAPKDLVNTSVEFPNIQDYFLGLSDKRSRDLTQRSSSPSILLVIFEMMGQCEASP